VDGYRISVAIGRGSIWLAVKPGAAGRGEDGAGAKQMPYSTEGFLLPISGTTSVN
jgi:hypothetical protein